MAAFWVTLPLAERLALPGDANSVVNGEIATGSDGVASSRP